jgi:hypothetical protein
MVALTYFDLTNLTVIKNGTYNKLKYYFRNSKVADNLEKGNLKDAGIVLFTLDEVPYEIEFGNQITFRCLGHTYSYGEFIEFFGE